VEVLMILWTLQSRRRREVRKEKVKQVKFWLKLKSKLKRK